MPGTPVLPIFESIPDALVIVDHAGSIVMANGNAHALFGYPPGQLTGRPVDDLVPSDARSRHAAHRAGYMAQPRVRPMGMANMTLSGQRRDGRQFPVEIALSPVDTPQGLFYLASVRDISETQRVRQALARARYDAVVARIGQLALASTTDERLASQVPRLLAEVLEVPLVAMIVLEHGLPMLRASVGLAGGVCPDWLSPTTGPLQEALQGSVAILGPGSDDARRQGWPGEFGSGAIVPLRDRGSAMGALVAASADPARFDHDALQLLQTVANLFSTLVQRRHYEDQLAHAQRLDALGQLTGGVAHDFNNLLTVISGSLQLLEAEGTDRPGAQEIINSALRSVGRGAELTSKLLVFARRQHLTPMSLDPATVLADLKLMLRSTLGEGIGVRIAPAAGLPPTFADASQLDNALLNLALNARDAMPRGGTVVISASERWIMADAARPARMAGHYVAFRVADTGAGMSPEVLAHAFEPFFTTKGLGRGSGLGLSMVYGFVQQSHGFIEIDSRPGVGTAVEMFLPVATTGMPQSNAPGATVGMAGGTGEMVLLVEDEDDVRKIATAFLSSLGYRVVAMPAAAQALAALESEARDAALLFTDVMLGSGMNGVELALAARVSRPAIGVLLTSGYDPVSARLASAGDFELLGKPYRREQLADAIRRNLPPAAKA
jgi:PAS domain S-box-containing protein